MNLAELLKIGEKTKESFILERDLGGLLNQNFLIASNNRRYVLRIPKENPELKESIRREYEGVGYVTNGDEYRYMNVKEQVDFSRLCIQKGIPVAGIIDHSENYMITEFIEGAELPDFLKSSDKDDNTEIVNKYLSSLIEAHKKGIVLGDRWGFNTIVTPKKELVHFYFDIKLTAEDAREFEISQGVYYSLLFSRDRNKVTEYLEDFFKRNEVNSLYDRNRVIAYLIEHSKYFKKNDANYGGIEREIEKLDDSIKSKTSATSSSTEQEKTMIFTCNNKRYRVPLDHRVAKPDHYTQFLAENLIPAENGDEKALDIGVGNGIYITLLLEKGYKRIDGIDINPAAVRFAGRIFQGGGLEDYVRVFEGSFPEDFNIKEKYNLIITNPPQIPTPSYTLKQENQLYYTNEGGCNGRRVIDKIIRAVPLFLGEDGCFQIVQADFTGLKETLSLMREVGLSPNISDTRKARPGPFTTSRIDYIESLGYKFKEDDRGLYFYLAVITGKK